MPLTKEPFTAYNLQEEKKENETIFTVRLNDSEALMLKEARQILRQPKNSTAIKQLAEIGYKCITSQETKAILETVFNNKRKNERTGFAEIG